MTIVIPKSLLRGIDREHLRLLDTRCKATETGSHFSLTTPLTGCLTTSRHTPSTVVYSNSVLEIPVGADDIITRVREIEIQFSCFFSRYGVTSSVSWRPSQRKLMFSDEGKGKFTIALKMFPDRKFLSPYMKSDFPVDVVLRQLLFFEVSVTSDDKRLSIRADRCYATPSNDRKDDLKHELIENRWMNLTYNYFLGFINDINDTHVMLIEIEVEPFQAACPTALVQKILNLQTFINAKWNCICISFLLQPIDNTLVVQY